MQPMHVSMELKVELDLPPHLPSFLLPLESSATGVSGESPSPSTNTIQSFRKVEIKAELNSEDLSSPVVIRFWVHRLNIIINDAKVTLGYIKFKATKRDGVFTKRLEG